MDTDQRDKAVTAQSVAQALNAMGIRPEIMAMPTFVELTNDRWKIVWLPREGWTPAA
jgi:hypothetical protein